MFGRVDLLEPLLDNWFGRLGEAQELFVITILVPATDGQPESVIFYRDVPAPVFGNNFFCLYSRPLQFLDEVLGNSFAPQTWVDLLLFALLFPVSLNLSNQVDTEP